MAKEEWGTKRACPSCGARFYDLRRSPIECPKCEHTFEAVTPSRPPRGAAEKVEKAAAVAAVAVDLVSSKKSKSADAADDEDGEDGEDDIEIDVDIDIDDDEDDEDDDVLEDASDLGGEEDVVPDVREHASGDDDR
ncbi:MAG: TIGR02300 family protein [Rhodospirillales bacterium]